MKTFAKFNLGILIVLFLNSCVTRPHNARISISDPKYVHAKRIALAYDIENKNGDHLWAQQALSQAFMENGWQVVERFRIEELFRETAIDEGGISKSFALDSAEIVLDSIQSSNMSLLQLKKFGEMFNVNYLGFYGFRHGTQLYLRIVECQTGKIVAVASYEGNWGLYVPVTRTKIADILVKASLRAAEDSEKTGKIQYALRFYSEYDSFPDANPIATYQIQDGSSIRKAGLAPVSSVEEWDSPKTNGNSSNSSANRVNPLVGILIVGGIVLFAVYVSPY